MPSLTTLLLCITVPLLSAEQRCQPDENGVRRYMGKTCASTTRYDDNRRGACGCGPHGEVAHNWTLSEYLTAPSQNYFDDGGNTHWCGNNCGSCVKLTPTVPLLKADPKCQPDSHGIRRLNGKPCASTTRYNDGHRGACGCGPPNSDTPFQWNLHDLTTAPNQKYFDNGGDKQWCGHNCGKCVKLTPTGGFIHGEGSAPSHHDSHIFLITNDCPINENRHWCGQNRKPGQNAHNELGYEAHFDLQNANGQIDRLGWNNPEVIWEEINCPSDLAHKWSQCECH